MLAQWPKGLWILVHLSLLLPLALLLWDFSQNQLTANPIEEATRRTGKTALVLLMLCLASRPAYDLLGCRPLLRLRRTLGLFAFSYASVHLTIFVGVDYGFDLDLIREALFEKRYALAGLSAFLLLTPLAITSTNWWRRRLGRNWIWLHRAVYLAAVLVVIHYFWGVKVDTRQPLQYGGMVLLLLSLRLPLVKRTIGEWRDRLKSTGRLV